MAHSKRGGLLEALSELDLDFAEALKHLALGHKIGHGGTFLFPPEAVRRRITEQAFADGQTRRDTTDEVLPYYLPAVLTSAADFRRRDLANGAGRKVEVKPGYGETVQLISGAVLRRRRVGPHPNAAAADPNYVIWDVVSGAPPTDGAPMATPARRQRTKRGGAPVADRGGRAVLAEELARKYSAAMVQHQGAAYDPFAAAMLDFYRMLKSDTARYGAVLAKANLLKDINPLITFLLVIEPFKTVGEPHVPDAVVVEWRTQHAGRTPYEDCIKEYEAEVLGGVPVGIVPNRAVFDLEVERQRLQISSVNPHLLADAVQKAYESLWGANRLGGISPVFSENPLGGATAAAEALWRDEFRFTVFEALRGLYRGVYDPRTFYALLHSIMLQRPGNNVKSELLLNCADMILHDVSPRGSLLLLLKFVNSTDFLYLPPDPLSLRKGAIGGTVGPINLADSRLYDRNGAALDLLRRTNMTNPSGISSATYEELRKYVARHGKLPTHVSDLIAMSDGRR
jgi:hypothetical protein